MSKLVLSVLVITTLVGLVFTPVAEAQYGPTLTASPNQVNAGGQVWVSWNNVYLTGNERIGMYMYGSPDFATGVSINIVSGSMLWQAPSDNGYYEFRLYSGNTRVATSNTFLVSGLTSVPGVFVTPSSVSAGDQITISWSGLDPRGTYWVGMYETWALDTRTVEGWSLSATSGSMTVMAPRTADTYELRVFWGGQRVLTSAPLVVVQQQKIPNTWFVGATVQLCIGTELYHGSGEKYPVEEVIHQHGTLAQVIDGRRYYDGQFWYDIRLSDGSTGWVRQGQADCDEAYRWRRFLGWNDAVYGDLRIPVDTWRLFFRTGPGTNYPALGAVAPEDYYPLLERQGDWGKVRTLDGSEGWINLNYVEMLVYG